MKLVHLVPGTGGTFYCQNCMRDVALLRALRKQGHDVLVVPIYLPIVIDAEGLAGNTPVFFGGINVFLQQAFSLFRKTPGWIDRLFDRPWLLRQAAAREGTTQASALGPMTLSMLQGPAGHQKKELRRLVDWLAAHVRPDVIHLSNSLLLGMAEELKRSLNAPIVCTLQDEENWLDHVGEPYRRQCWDAMAACAKHVDAFIAVSAWYAGEMARRMALDRAKIHVAPLGIDLEGAEPAPLAFDPPVIGYLSRMTPSLGLGLLTDAFIELKQVPELARLKLRATGGTLGGDAAFVASLKKNIEAHAVANDAEFLDAFDHESRGEFLRSLSVLSVPSAGGEAFGMYILEALAMGVPVVQPDTGGFPEVVEATGGGLIYDSSRPHALSETLASLLLHPERARELGRRGREAVLARFGIDRMASDVIAVYESLRRQ